MSCYFSELFITPYSFFVLFLKQIRLNQGISEDNKSTPSVPNFLPPLHYFAPWLFQVSELSLDNGLDQVWTGLYKSRETLSTG